MRVIGWRWGMAGAAVLAIGPAMAGQVAPVRVPRIEAIASNVMLPATAALYEGYVRDGKMPGIVGAFGVGDGPTIFIAAGRLADTPAAPAAGPDSLWRIYSMTKPVTAMAAMQLIEAGKLRLDQPVGDILPAFAQMRVLTDPAHSLASRPAARPITIRNLLTHTAGLGYNIVTTGPLLAEYERLGILPEEVDARTEVRMRAVRPKTLAEFADRVATLPLIADPGTTWSYSIGLDVMGAVIERASGEPFDGYVQRHILDPLRLRSTYWQVPAGAAGRLATNYAFVGANRVPLDPGATSVFLGRPSFPYGGAGLVSSARDYDRFLHALANRGTLDGAQVLQPETAALMMSNLLPAGVTFPSPDGTPVGFGAGGFVLLADRPGGAAKGTYGWSGAAGTQAWVDPARHFRGTIMVNYFPDKRWPVRDETARALFADAARLRP